jgi:hypothetical protein
MSVIAFEGLRRYTAFTTDGACPTFALYFSLDEALVLPYGYLYGAVWYQGSRGRGILLHHRFRRLYVEGDNLQPLLRGFEYYTIRTVHIFDPDRHAPVIPGACVVRHIDDKYGGD